MPEQLQYKHLTPKRGSSYRQLYVAGRIRAEVIYRETVGLAAARGDQRLACSHEGPQRL
jgi:hypothetical protein